MKMESKRSQAALRRIVCLVVLTALLCALPALAFAKEVPENELSNRAGVYGWRIVTLSTPKSVLGSVGYPPNSHAGNSPEMDLDVVLNGIPRYNWQQYELAPVIYFYSTTLNSA